MLFLAFLYFLLFPQLGSTLSLPVHYLDELGEQCHTPYVPSIQIQSVHNQFPPLEGIIKCSLKDDASLGKLNAQFNNNSNNKVLVPKFVVRYGSLID